MTETLAMQPSHVERSHWNCWGGSKSKNNQNANNSSQQAGSTVNPVDPTTADPTADTQKTGVPVKSNGRTWQILCGVLKGLAYAGLTGTALVSAAVLVGAVVAMFFPGLGQAAAGAFAFAGATVAGMALAAGTFFVVNATAITIASSAVLGTVAVATAILVASEFMCRKKTPAPGGTNPTVSSQNQGNEVQPPLSHSQQADDQGGLQQPVVVADAAGGNA